MLTELDYYLSRISATSGEFTDQQARFNADCWWYLWLYEHNRTPSQFLAGSTRETLMRRTFDIDVPAFSRLAFIISSASPNCSRASPGPLGRRSGYQPPMPPTKTRVPERMGPPAGCLPGLDDAAWVDALPNDAVTGAPFMRHQPSERFPGYTRPTRMSSWASRFTILIAAFAEPVG
jgi:hypothetical protein